MNRETDSKEFSRRNFLKNGVLLAGSMVVVAPLTVNSAQTPEVRGADETMKIVKSGENYILESPFFEFCLDTRDGLRAVWWKNKLTGRKLNMGNGNEVEFTIGLPGSRIIQPKTKLSGYPKIGSQPLNESVFELVAEEVNARILVTYSWNGTEPILTKSVTLINEGTTTWNRLMDLYLGSYSTDAASYKDPDWPVLITKTPWGNADLADWNEPAGTLRGYPSYPENQFFVGLAHPSGYSLLNGQKLEIHHHPGMQIEPGNEFNSVQAVYGVAEKDQARAAFKKHIHSRMRRVLRGHDRPYAIIDTCGAQDNTGEKFDNVSEAWCLKHISNLEQSQKDAGLHFDNYVIEFWHDPSGTIRECDPKRFPNNFDKVAPALNSIGTNLGIWLSSGYQSSKTTLDTWTIGANPALIECSTTGDGKGVICRSTPPANQMYIDGLIYQIRKNHIRQIKLDTAGENAHDITPLCNNPKHKHLPGVLYSIEANQNAQIELLTALDRECPEVFFTLYWGHLSPWWLLYADTIYDIGFRMEMARLALPSALFGRSSNVRRLDQGKYMAAKDYPDLAWDSLGISLSDWRWNNRLGPDKWQEGVLMDICRGSMLLHIWSDNDGIPVKERAQMAEFINLLKALPDCFSHPVAIGNPFKDDWWGYCCTNGKRAMIAIDNGSWEDQLVTLELNAVWNLPDAVEWDIYCWYPGHTKFKPVSGSSFGAKAKIAIRPFTALMLEIVPKGHKPSLKKRNWKEEAIPVQFSENARKVEITTVKNKTEKGSGFTVTGKVPLIKGQGWLAITTDFVKAGKPFQSLSNKPTSMNGILAGKTAEFEPALNNPLFPAPWQTYRLRVNEDSSGKEFQLTCETEIPKEVEIIFNARFVPINYTN